jgi:hypothetical protein
MDLLELRKNAPRILGMNSFDLTGTALFAYWYASKYDKDFLTTFGQLFLVGEAVHLLLGISTPVTNKIVG